MAIGPDINIPARVSSLETSVDGLHSELGEVKQSMNAGFRDIQIALEANNRTNWPVLISGAVLVMAIYAAAIRPVQNDVDRLEKGSGTLATAVVQQNLMINEIRSQLLLNAEHVKLQNDAINQLQTYGSPINDKRLSLLEFKLGMSK